MTIPHININNTGIPNIYVNATGIPLIRSQGTGIYPVRGVFVSEIRPWEAQTHVTTPLAPPVVTVVGSPVVDMPGCVKVHKENAKRDPSSNKNLVNDDPKGNVVLCDAGMPYYEPPDYDARELTWQTVTPDGKICETIWEPVPAVEQFLPTAGVVTTTAVIATVATTSALFAKPLADLLLKVIKPVVKKVMTKVNSILGRQTRRPSRSEVLADQYRLKKGLLPLKKTLKKKK